MGERVGVSSLTQERGNRVEEKKEKWSPSSPWEELPRDRAGRARRRTHSWVEPKSLFFRKEAQCGHPGSLRNPSGRTDLRVQSPRHHDGARLRRVCAWFSRALL